MNGRSSALSISRALSATALCPLRVDARRSLPNVPCRRCQLTLQSRRRPIRRRESVAVPASCRGRFRSSRPRGTLWPPAPVVATRRDRASSAGSRIGDGRTEARLHGHRVGHERGCRRRIRRRGGARDIHPRRDGTGRDGPGAYDPYSCAVVSSPIGSSMNTGNAHRRERPSYSGLGRVQRK